MANLKNTTIDDPGFIRLPIGTTSQRPVPDSSQIRYNTDNNEYELYNGFSWVNKFVYSARGTGGNNTSDITINGVNYRIHTFSSTGLSNFTVSRAGLVEYLLVAGGGAGGDTGSSGGGGGGGGGGVVAGSIVLLPDTYQVVVGQGGVPQDTASKQFGEDSTVFGITAIGGGAGGGSNNPRSDEVGGSGGSGGGGAGQAGGTPGNFSDAGGNGTPGQGHSGGFAWDDSSTGTYRRSGGGGGGAGESGKNGLASIGGNGGDGVISFITGGEQYYGGGGGGGPNNRDTPVTFGLGGRGGGADAGTSGSRFGGDGTPNTGGGGAGVSSDGSSGVGAGNGGSGIVIVRYRLDE